MRTSKLMLIAALFLISCSESGNLFDEKNQARISPDFSCEISKNIMFLHGYIYIDGEFVSLSRSLEKYLQDFFWIVNSDTIREHSQVEKEVPYGKHFVKLFITDIFGDTASISDSVWVKEPFSINLLSPVDSFSTNSPIFIYEINGEDKWEAAFVYVSENKDSLWKEENRNNTLEPPYFWGVKAFTEDSIFTSEIRWVQPQKN